MSRKIFTGKIETLRKKMRHFKDEAYIKSFSTVEELKLKIKQHMTTIIEDTNEIFKKR